MHKIIFPAMIMLFMLACFAPPAPPAAQKNPSVAADVPILTESTQPAEVAPVEPLPVVNECWSLFWANSYCLAYDPGLWQPQGAAGEPGDLVNTASPDCFISEEGPMGLPPDFSSETIGTIVYTAVDRLSESPAFMGYIAMENRDPSSENAPSFFVYIPAGGTLSCLDDARQVLATLQLK